MTATVDAPPGDVPAGANVQVSCFAEGSPSMGGATNVLRVDVAVSGGTVTPSSLTGAVSQKCSASTSTCSVIQGAVAWATPTIPGTLTATCKASYQGTFGGPGTASSAPATLTTVAGGPIPPVVMPVEGKSQVVVGATSSFSVTAFDPNDPPLPLSYAWSATGGSLTPDASDPAAASWTAPETPGTYEISVVVSNGKTASTAKRSVSAVLATYQAGLPVPLVAPRRVCADDDGALYVVDGRQGDLGSVVLVTARGETRGFATIPEPALAATYGAGFLWVATAKGSLYKVDRYGRIAGRIALADGAFQRPLGMAYDASSMTLWIADSATGRVRVIRPDGTTVAVIGSAGGAPLVEPIDVAVDAGAGRAYVLVKNAKAEGDLAAGEPVAAARFVHAFDLATGYLASYVQMGGGAGQLTRAGGIAVADGRIYLSDVFQGMVQVVGRDGAAIGTIGSFGMAQGELLNPTGLAVMRNGDLAVANSSLARVDRFGSGKPLPVCTGDSDCDGLADAWELANGLNATWAGDALLDYDGDGLNNAEEYAYGTNPRRGDTDGDGYADGDELLAGFDPRDPNDHRPSIVASGPAETPPGLVKMLATVAGPRSCTIQWKQVSGPAVDLASADSTSPSFIARVPGVYAFEAVASSGSTTSAPARVQVAVRNVPPMADAGRLVVTSPGESFRLDALFSSDANGDALTYAWDQTLGAAVVGSQSGGILGARPRGVGLYKFMLTATDPRGAASSVEVPVLVAGGPVATALAAAVPPAAEVGETVVLDASESLLPDDDDVTFAWEQVAGPTPVTITDPGRAVASFAPPAPGRYAFAVTVGGGKLRSPAARVEVFVASAGRALPTITSAAARDTVVAANTPVTLEASGTGTGYAWTQISGPAAGLTYGDSASATAVPFSPGFYVFEVSAVEGDAVSRPARVAFEARASIGRAIPQARAVAVGTTFRAGQLVFLDGRASTGAARFRWTQVAGPWVAPSAQAAVTTLRAHTPGRYAFELEVDDGTVRSAPARVEIDVAASDDAEEGGR